MVHLTRIYTRTGDDGSTALGNFERVAKTDSRLVAYADTHEANAAIGVAVAFLRQTETAPADIDAGGVADVLERTQNELFDVGDELTVAQSTTASGPRVTGHES